MEKMTKNELQQKSEIYIQPNFRPMYLNTNRAMDLIHNLEMIKGNNDIFNTFELKFLKRQEEDKLFARRQREAREGLADVTGVHPNQENQDEY
jgi:hypothetical protein